MRASTGVVLLVCGIALVLACCLHDVSAASGSASSGSGDSAAKKAAQPTAAERARAQREREAAERAAALARKKERERTERRAARKRDRERKAKAAEAAKKAAAEEAKLDPKVRAAKKRARRKEKRDRIARKRAERWSKRLSAAIQRNIRVGRERRARKKQSREQRRATNLKLDKWLSDKRDADHLTTRGRALTKLRAIAKKVNGTSDAAIAGNKQKLRDRERNGRIWQMTGAEFREYAFEGPRPYGLVVALTALAPENKCEYCQTVHKLFVPLSELLNTDAEAIVAAHYNASVTAKTMKAADDAAAAAGVSDKRPLPVFVAEMDVERGREVFGALGLRGAPTVLYIPAKSSTANAERAMSTTWLKGLGTAATFVLQSDTKLTDLLSWSNKLAHKSIEPPRPPLSRYWFTLAPAAVVLAVIGFAFRALLFRLSWVWRSVALYGGLVLLGFCWGGGWYSILNDLAFDWPKVPRSLYAISRFRVMDVVNKGGNSQNGTEGYVLGALQIIAALLVVTLTKRARIRHTQPRTVAGASKSQPKAAVAATVAPAGTAADAKSDAASPATAPAAAAAVAPAEVEEASVPLWQSVLLFPIRFALGFAFFAFSLAFGPLPPRSRAFARSRAASVVSHVWSLVWWVVYAAYRAATSPVVLAALVLYAWYTVLRVYTAKNGHYHMGMLHGRMH